MNTHVYFNEDGDQIPVTTPMTPPSTKREPTVQVMTLTESSVDSSSEYDDTESLIPSDDEDFSSDTSSDSARVVSIQSHAPSSHCYRERVDMSQFDDLQNHLTVLVHMEPKALDALAFFRLFW